MNRPFKEHHLITMLQEYELQTLPLDLFIRNYFRDNKALGSKDRGFIAETLYGMMRWRGLLDFLCPAPMSWEKRYEIFISPDFEVQKERKDIPDHIRLSFPKVLYDLLVNSLGIEKAHDICLISNTQAPTTVRVNTLKTSREEVMKRWQGQYQIRPCQNSSNGIVFTKRVNFYELPEFQGGLFEVQDEGSQLLAGLVEVKKGQLVMDYCAGAGGKTLAFAPQMDNTGQIYLHDIRKHALQDAKKRLKRAGIQNAQIVCDDEAKLKKIKKRMDWVLVDAPCTGTGTMRRNPDMKWKFDAEVLTRLLGQQRTIFEKALSFLKPGGQIVYATCSVLKEENQNQIEHFIKTYGLELVKEPFESFPIINGMDGFFGAVMRKAVD